MEYVVIFEKGENNYGRTSLISRDVLLSVERSKKCGD